MDNPTIEGGALSKEKATVLAALYGYLGRRLDSVSRRSSILLAFQASLLGLTATPNLQASAAASVPALTSSITSPSIISGIAGMSVILWSELARVKKSDDLLSRIAFSGENLRKLQDQLVKCSDAAILGDMAANTRIVGGFLARKSRLLNFGTALFVLSVAFYAVGL